MVSPAPNNNFDACAARNFVSLNRRGNSSITRKATAAIGILALTSFIRPALAGGVLNCWGSIVPAPDSDNWAVGILLPILAIMIALACNMIVNIRLWSWSCCAKDSRPLWGRGLPKNHERDTIIRSWIWMSGLLILPMLCLAVAPWMLFNYTPTNSCSVGLAARLYIGTETVNALSAVHLCILPIIIILDVCLAQNYLERRFWINPQTGVGRIGVRTINQLVMALVAFLVIIWSVYTWVASGPMGLTLLMVLFPIYVLALHHAARLTLRCHELELRAPVWSYCAAVILQPAVYLRRNPSLLWFVILLLTCLNFLDSLQNNNGARMQAILSLQVLACSTLSLDLNTLKEPMAVLVFPEEAAPYSDVAAWTEDLNAILLAHHNEIQSHHALKPEGAEIKYASDITNTTTTTTTTTTVADSNKVTPLTPKVNPEKRGSTANTTASTGSWVSPTMEKRGSTLASPSGGEKRGSTLRTIVVKETQ